eukprot:4457325-Pyramimonas_sp.AAC.1
MPAALSTMRPTSRTSAPVVSPWDPNVVHVAFRLAPPPHCAGRRPWVVPALPLPLPYPTLWNP